MQIQAFRGWNKRGNDQRPLTPSNLRGGVAYNPWHSQKDRKDSVPLSLCVEYDKKRTYPARYVRDGMGKIA